MDSAMFRDLVSALLDDDHGIPMDAFIILLAEATSGVIDPEVMAMLNKCKPQDGRMYLPKGKEG